MLMPVDQITYKLESEPEERVVTRRNKMETAFFCNFLEATGVQEYTVAVTDKDYRWSSTVTRDEAAAALVEALKKAMPFMRAEDETWHHTAMNIIEDLGLRFHGE